MFQFFILVLIGFLVMVTGLIEYVLIAYLAYLLIMVVLFILGRIWLWYQKIFYK